MLIGKLTWINAGFEGIEYPTLRQVVFDVVGEHAFPILTGLDFGHHDPPTCRCRSGSRRRWTPRRGR